jgi:hypothetical protein
VACSVGEYLTALAGRDAALHARVVAFMSNPAITHAGLARALEADGAKLTAGTIRRHRMRGTVEGCKCPQGGHPAGGPRD